MDIRTLPNKHFRDQNKSFESLVAHYSTAPLTVDAGGDSRVVSGAVVSANYFPMLGINPFYERGCQVTDCTASNCGLSTSLFCWKMRIARSGSISISDSRGAHELSNNLLTPRVTVR